MPQGFKSLKIKKVYINKSASMSDEVAVELPLQIMLSYPSPRGQQENNLVITMRTPGEDKYLSLGYLYSEGIISNRDDVISVKVKADDIVVVYLKDGLQTDLKSLKRNDLSTGACGMCGKESLEAIYFPLKKNFSAKLVINNELVFNLPGLLKKEQSLFQKTGGIHASGLFSKDGTFIRMSEDIGRHNSLDKLIGWAICQDNLVLEECILVVSGRAGFELIQKAIVAGIQIMLSVGAPSSMAVAYAETYGLTLIGFVKDQSFNVYSHPSRIQT